MVNALNNLSLRLIKVLTQKCIIVDIVRCLFNIYGRNLHRFATVIHFHHVKVFRTEEYAVFSNMINIGGLMALPV